jgi:hypothetical protein
MPPNYRLIKCYFPACTQDDEEPHQTAGHVYAEWREPHQTAGHLARELPTFRSARSAMPGVSLPTRDPDKLYSVFRHMGFFLGLPPKQIGKLFNETYSEWNKDNAPRLGAALAYYTIFSLAPLLVVVIAIAGWRSGRRQPGVRSWGRSLT